MIRLTPLHCLAAAVLAAETVVAALIFFPAATPAYQRQFIAGTDCTHPATGGTYTLGETKRPISRSSDAAPDGIFVCNWWTVPDGAWNMGQGSRLYFRLPPDTGALELALTALGVVAPAHPEQRVELEANGVTLPAITLDSTQLRIYRVEIPAEAVAAGGGTLDLALRFPDAISPRQLRLSRERARRAIFLAAVMLSRK
jgi:hypothetical protein